MAHTMVCSSLSLSKQMWGSIYILKGPQNRWKYAVINNGLSVYFDDNINAVGVQLTCWHADRVAPAPQKSAHYSITTRYRQLHL